MKLLASLILLSLFLVVGCQDDNSILEPTNELSDVSTGYKGRVILPKYITLPESGDLSKVTEDSYGWTVEEFVPRDEDTELVIEQKYEGGVHGVVVIIAKLKILAGTVKEDGYAAMNINKENGTVTIKSSQVFNQYAELYLKFEGLDLKYETKDNISFDFLGEDLSFTQAIFKEINLDVSNGTLELKQGMISQFAQYGFTTTL